MICSEILGFPHYNHLGVLALRCQVSCINNGGTVGMVER